MTRLSIDGVRLPTAITDNTKTYFKLTGQIIMFKKNLATIIMSLFIPAVRAPTTESHCPIVKGKGQLRSAKPKPSGAAQLKRDAKKRKNKR